MFWGLLTDYNHKLRVKPNGNIWITDEKTYTSHTLYSDTKDSQIYVFYMSSSQSGRRKNGERRVEGEKRWERVDDVHPMVRGTKDKRQKTKDTKKTVLENVYSSMYT